MRSWKAACETVHLLALSLWLGVVVSAGAFAAIVFPTMRGLDPHLPEFEKYQGEHWRIAGGRVAQQVFLLTDIAQFVCATVTIATLVCMLTLFGLPKRRTATVVRALSLGVALACAAGLIIIVAPQFNAALKLHWAAAAAGNAAEAAKHKEVLDRLHPISSWLMSGTAGAVLVALLAGLWTATSGWREGTALGDRPATASPYPEPSLRTPRGGIRGGAR